VKSKKSDKQSDKPLVETDSYRIWSPKHYPAGERKEIEQITLGVHPGERIHNIVVIDLGSGCVLKVLSKARDTDGCINVFLKLEKPFNKCSIIRSDEWITKNSYDKLLNVLKKELGENNVSITSGEDVHVGIAFATEPEKAKKHAEGIQERNKQSPKSWDV